MIGSQLATAYVKNANLVCWGLCFWVISSAMTGCKPQGAAESGKSPAEIKSASTFFPIKVGSQIVQVQLAVHSSEMMRGLMGRRDLDRNEGMFFIFEKPERMNFYMRNTPTALDVGFFTADGTLREVYPMYPFDETSIPSKSPEIQFALEVAQGWFQQAKVKPGATLDLKALAAALKSRGFILKAFGLQAYD